MFSGIISKFTVIVIVLGIVIVIVIIRKDRNETVINFNNNDNGEVWNSKLVEEWFYFTIHVWVCIYLLFEFKAMLNLLRGRFFKKLFFDKQRYFESYLSGYHSGTSNPNCGIQHSNRIESKDFVVGWIWFDPRCFSQFKHHNGYYGNCIYSWPYFGALYLGGQSILAANYFFFAGSIVTISAFHHSIIIVGRLIFGFGISLVSMAMLLFISEYSP